LPVGRITTLLSLSVDLGSVHGFYLFHSLVLVLHPEAELCLRHPSFELCSVVGLVGWNDILVEVGLVRRAQLGVTVAKREVSFAEVGLLPSCTWLALADHQTLAHLINCTLVLALLPYVRVRNARGEAGGLGMQTV
jgi:hypothetical protein